MKSVSGVNRVSDGRTRQDAKATRDRYYIIGIHHGPAKEKSQINPLEADYEIYRERMDELNRDMVGKPITTMHPNNGKDYVSSRDWKTSVRGKCVHTGKLTDGSYFFIGEMPLQPGNPKLWLTRHAIKKGKLNSVSLGNTFDVYENPQTGDWDAKYKGDHIALVDTGTEQREGCSVLHISRKSVPIELFQKTSQSERDAAMQNLISKISEKNSTSIHELSNASPASSNSTAPPESDVSQYNTISSGMQTAQSQQGNMQQNDAGYGSGQPSAQPMQDDNVEQQQQNQMASQENNQSAEQNDQFSIDDVNKYSKEQLAAALNRMMSDMNNIASENNALKQEGLKQKVGDIEKVRKELIDRIAYSQLQSVDGEPTEENKRQIHKNVSAMVNEMYPTPKSLLQLPPDKAAKKMEKCGKGLATLNKMMHGIAVASKEAYQERQRARAILNQQGGADLYSRLQRQGVQSQSMKRGGVGAPNQSVSSSSATGLYGNTSADMRSQRSMMSSVAQDSVLPTDNSNSSMGVMSNQQQSSRPNFQAPPTVNKDFVKRMIEEGRSYNQAQRFMNRSNQSWNNQQNGV